MTTPPFAPGCFGSALTFKAGDMVCSQCSFASECSVEHEKSMARLRAAFGVTPPATKQVVEKPTPRADELRLALPKKVRDLLDKLDNGNYNAVAKLQEGRNPFGASLPFMSVACHLLLRMRSPLTRDALVRAYMAKFDWQKPSAEEKARIALVALVHIGAVKSNDGQFTIQEKADV